MGQQERLLEFINSQGLTKSAFERNAGLSNGYVAKLKGAIGEEKLEGIFKAYPALNKIWLLTGEGEMLKSANNSASKSKRDVNFYSSDAPYTTYLLPMSAMGGSLTGFALPGAELKDCEKIISPIENVDFAITVYGESMSPEYPSGSRVLIKKIDPSLFIEWGKVYVLDTPNGVIIKEVLECKEKEGYVVCHSINPRYADFEVPLAEVFGMYRVLMCLAVK